MRSCSIHETWMFVSVYNVLFRYHLACSGSSCPAFEIYLFKTAIANGERD
jgi:hypothetical protein